MKHSLGDEARLKHILDAIADIEELTKDQDPVSFLSDKSVKYACVFQLEVIGEAANHITEDLRQQYAQVNWRQIIGLRNIIAHEYFGIDYNRIGEIIFSDLEVLKKEIKKIISDL